MRVWYPDRIDTVYMPEREKQLPPEALRALKEAEQRRLEKKEANFPKELGGREGVEPVRFGDWEKKGIAIDF